jgi:DNA-directed RNA polymerase subunit M/transcription elongation factor TFIIS
MIRFPCPHCQKKLKAPERAVGKIINCPKCNQSLVIPPPVRSPGQPLPDSGNVAGPISGGGPARVEPSSDKVPVNCPGCGRSLLIEPNQFSLKLQCSHCNTIFVLKEPDLQPETVRYDAPDLFDFEAQSKAEEGSLEGIEMAGFGNEFGSFRSVRIPYVETSLIYGERIVYCGRIHGAVFIAPVILFLLGAIFLLVGIVLIQEAPKDNLQRLAGRESELSSGFMMRGSGLCLSCFGPLLFCSGLITLISTLIYVRTTELAVTNQRVIAKVGLISRRTLEMNVAKVENIQVDQGILGLLLGYGKITVVGTGGTREPFWYIADPLSFRRAVQAQLHPDVQSRA